MYLLKAIRMKKFVCKNCGVVNVVANEVLKSDDDWLECILPTGFEWTLPAGKITPIIGDPIYVSAQGNYFSRQAYLDKYYIDPEIAYELMRSKVKVQTATQIIANQNSKLASSVSKMFSIHTP